MLDIFLIDVLDFYINRDIILLIFIFLIYSGVFGI